MQPVTTLWTTEQVLLSAVIVACCAVMFFSRRRHIGQTNTVIQSPLPDTTSRKGKKKRASHVRSGAAVPDAHPHRATERATGAWPTHLFWSAFLFVAVFLLLRINHPLGVRTDSWSEANTLVSGLNYAKLGLWANWGAAQHQWVSDTHPPDPFYLYAQYPVVSNLINGCWRLAGVNAVAVHRMLPAACSLIAVILWLRLYRKFVDPGVAALAATAMLLSYGFLAYADNLYFHGYALLACALAITCFVHAMTANDGIRVRYFALCGLFMFLTALFTWEYHLFLVLFIAGYAFLFPCPVRRPWLLLLGVPLLVALGLNTAQRKMAAATIPSPSVVPGDGFGDDMIRRTIGFDSAMDTPEGVSLGNYPQWLLLRYYKFYGIPAITLAAIVILIARDSLTSRSRNAPIGPGVRLVILLLLSGSAWWLIMLQHTAVHPHVMRHGLPGYALLMAMAWCICGKMIRPPSTANTSTQSRISKWAAGLLLAALVYVQVEGLICNLRMHIQDEYHDRRERTEAGFTESRLMESLSLGVPHGAVILTNSTRLPMMRYASQRPAYLALNVTYPPNEPLRARSLAEMAFNHLRELYNDQLPSLYFVYQTASLDWPKLLAADSMLRLLTVDDPAPDVKDLLSAAATLNQAWQSGRTDRTACPIVGRSGSMLVFRLDPLVPRLMERWAPAGYPTSAEFGPPR